MSAQLRKNINVICSFLAKQEGKKHQATIGDIRELVKLLAKWMADDVLATTTLLQYGVELQRKASAKARNQVSKKRR